MSHRPVCVKCQVEMKPEKNDVAAVYNDGNMDTTSGYATNGSVQPVVMKSFQASVSTLYQPTLRVLSRDSSTSIQNQVNS